MKTNKKVIFGLVGSLASGKGTTAAYLASRYQAQVFRYSSILRAVLKILYLEETRDNLIRLSESLLKTFGDDLLAKIILKQIQESSAKIIVVDGIRRPADFQLLKNLKNFVLVEIYALPEVRYKRLIKRGENRDDKKKSFQEFLADHRRSTERNIQKVARLAQEKIDNNGSLEDLYRQIDQLVKKYVQKN